MFLFVFNVGSGMAPGIDRRRGHCRLPRARPPAKNDLGMRRVWQQRQRSDPKKRKRLAH